MAQVDITINGRAYKVACDDGQEDHLIRLGSIVGERVDELVSQAGQIGDARLLVMASLLIADEMSELRRQADEAPVVEAAPASTVDEDLIASGIETLAKRIESIAERLEEN